MAPGQMEGDVEMTGEKMEGEFDQVDQDSADGTSEEEVQMEPVMPRPAIQRRSYHSPNDWFDRDSGNKGTLGQIKRCEEY